MSSRKVLLISAVAAILIPLPLIGLDLVTQYPPGVIPSLKYVLEKFILAFCPFALGLFDNTVTFASLSTLLMVNVIYYCVVGSFIWLGFNYSRAFWIPVAIVVPPLVVFGFLW